MGQGLDATFSEQSVCYHHVLGRCRGHRRRELLRGHRAPVTDAGVFQVLADAGVVEEPAGGASRLMGRLQEMDQRTSAEYAAQATWLSESTTRRLPPNASRMRVEIRSWVQRHRNSVVVLMPSNSAISSRF